ncbi:Fe2+-enterobactin ABC transporter substrate-binding protein [Corynebacterium pygosceleis]|uniref:Fe2+-enterobactin ABC transporter substrate-binding protein n=1 Tax=Corynebacterium pygosceleis TaxID=2800406 RepID=A0ABT3WUQ2_9CORY|nr:Fe2+-enterobactin ABC transporter substrate-binding protein [Corynebacterium pygosceleis]MCK7674615.1 Fe2+-enterobactin ABC transporter substrate-binding protein [Corynebacterium pygosceleis]MCX7445044.1 Fe2+-enterobactin ABC transporter substrate-binding protein [Corynebacterium pygosceleis]
MTSTSTRDPRHLRRILQVGATTVALALGLAACNSSVEETGSDGDGTSSSTTSAETSATGEATAESSWPRTIDAVNGEVEIPARPERIVSTSVTLTGSLLAIDAPVVASGAGQPDTPFSDSQGFFRQWAGVADERGVSALYNKEPDLEAILAEKPDLVLVAATGRDSAVDLVDQLSPVVPTVVIDYGDKTWEDVTRQLGEITGHEKEAEKALDDFDALVSEVADAITLPEQPVNTMVYLPDGKGANVFTDEAAQSRLLASLGFEIAPIPDSVKGNESKGKRSDIVKVSGENLPVAMNGETVLLAAAPDKRVSEVLADPALAGTAAVQNERVFALGADTFRLDYFSATDMVEKIRELFAS